VPGVGGRRGKEREKRGKVKEGTSPKKKNHQSQGTERKKDGNWTEVFPVRKVRKGVKHESGFLFCSRRC